MLPRIWAKKTANIVFWQEHEEGGPSTAWESPDAAVGDMRQHERTVDAFSQCLWLSSSYHDSTAQFDQPPPSPRVFFVPCETLFLL